HPVPAARRRVACLRAGRCFPRTPRPAPRPALFPYTTLFRSLPGVLRRDGPAAACRLAERCRTVFGRENFYVELQRNFVRGDRALDRKSTRLNSSHRTISYAVFCLKKKTDSAASRRRPPPHGP